jgi:hypothetical protein
MLMAFGSRTVFEAFSSIFLGPSVFQLMMTPVSVSPVANFRCGFYSRSPFVME